MINSQTVFVLGAGASQPYGLPLGHELLLNILDRYNSDQGRANHLFNTTEFTRPGIDEFTYALRHSGLMSVDAFLERRGKFMGIGKALMGIELLHGEVHGNLWGGGENWLRYLYNVMIGETLEQFAENKVAFVTFNYDRSVEHFLYTSVMNSFGRPEADTAETVKKIPIVHLHGRLGHLPWQGPGETAIEYGQNQIDPRIMGIVSNEIKVVHEELSVDRDRDFETAKRLLEQARRVYMLGFGFGVRNVERLALTDLAPHSFLGTAFGMTQRESGNCRMLSGGRVGLSNQQCLQFFRELAEFD